MGVIIRRIGLVPDDTTSYPNLEDLWQGSSDLATVVNREQIQPLCTWPELMVMHESGLVDMQSHSLTHTRINISPKVVDFIHPHFDSHFFENVNVPVARDDNAERPLRPLRLGQPIYESASRLSDQPRFLENTHVSQQLVKYVAENGGSKFFSKRNWRSVLSRQYVKLLAVESNPDEYEVSKEMKLAIRHEMSVARQQLENRFNKRIRHFCYPWFQGSELSDQIAAECGYHTLFYGLDMTQNQILAQKNLLRIRRISEEYLFCLPGKGRHTHGSVWVSRLKKYLMRETIAGVPTKQYYTDVSNDRNKLSATARQDRL